MSEIKLEEVKNALQGVRLPTQKQNILEMNLVQSLEAKEQSVLISIRLPEENSTFEKSLRYQIQKAIHSKHPKASVVVEFESQKQNQEQKNAEAPKIGSIIAIGSGKGGVGKSSITVNLATALKKLHYKVGILDCDVYGPSIPTMLGVEGQKPMVIDQKLQPIEAHGMQLMSAGFFVEEGQGLVWRGPMIHKLIQQFYMDVAWDGTDVLLIDLPPGTGDAPLSIAQSMPLTGAIMVSLPQKVSIVDVHKSLAMFTHLKIPVFGVVENMSEFVCPECGNSSEIFSRGGVREFCQSQDIPFLGEISIDPRLRRLCDEGKPFLMEFEETQAGAAFMKLAERLRPLLKTADDLESDDPLEALKK